MDINEYMKNPNRCPVCEAEGFDLSDEYSEDRYVWRYWECGSCGAKWEETYTLTEMSITYTTADSPVTKTDVVSQTD